MDSSCEKETKKPFTDSKRKAPPYNANRCCGMIMKGKDGRTLYESRADKNGRCSWFVVDEQKASVEEERGRSKKVKSVRFAVASKRPRSLSPDGLPRAGWLRTQIKEQHMRPLKESIVLRQPLKAPRVARASTPSAVARLATKASLWDVLRAEVQLEGSEDQEEDEQNRVAREKHSEEQEFGSRRKRSRSLSPDGLPKREFLVKQMRESDSSALEKVIVAQQPEKAYRVAKAKTLTSLVALATKPQLVAALRLRKQQQPVTDVASLEIVEIVRQPIKTEQSTKQLERKTHILAVEPAAPIVSAVDASIKDSVPSPSTAMITKTTTTSIVEPTAAVVAEQAEKTAVENQAAPSVIILGPPTPTKQVEEAKVEEKKETAGVIVLPAPPARSQPVVKEERQSRPPAKQQEEEPEKVEEVEDEEEDETEICDNSEDEVLEHLLKFDDGAFVVRESRQQPDHYRVYVSWPQPSLSADKQFALFTLSKTGKTGDKNKWTLKQRYDVKNDGHTTVTELREFASILEALQKEFPDAPLQGFINVCSVEAPEVLEVEKAEEEEEEEATQTSLGNPIERIRDNAFADKRMKGLLRGIFNDAMIGEKESEVFLKTLRNAQPELFDYLRSEQVEYSGAETPANKVRNFNNTLRLFGFQPISLKARATSVTFPLSPPAARRQ